MKRVLRDAQGDGSAVDEMKGGLCVAITVRFACRGRQSLRMRYMLSRVLRVALLVLCVLVESLEVLSEGLFGEVVSK